MWTEKGRGTLKKAWTSTWGEGCLLFRGRRDCACDGGMALYKKMKELLNLLFILFFCRVPKNEDDFTIDDENGIFDTFFLLFFLRVCNCLFSLKWYKCILSSYHDKDRSEKNDKIKCYDFYEITSLIKSTLILLEFQYVYYTNFFMLIGTIYGHCGRPLWIFRG